MFYLFKLLLYLLELLVDTADLEEAERVANVPYIHMQIPYKISQIPDMDVSLVDVHLNYNSDTNFH